MDYLDPKKRLQHTIILFVGYALIAVAIAIATMVLLNQANGFGFGKDGTVIRNGFAFFSSQPSPADIFVDGKLAKSKTSTRLNLPEAIYQIKMQRTGYVPWQRTIEVEGGKITHYDYPMLFPTKLVTTKLKTYDTAPSLVTQSSDKRWLVVAPPGSFANFEVYDLKNPTKVSTPIALPAGIVSPATATQSWKLVEWADDNQHVLLSHKYDDKSEYILVDRQNPEQSLNLSKTLASNPTELSLIDRKYDRFYLFDAPTTTLAKASLKEPTLVSVLTGVFAYNSYGNDTLLYTTAVGAPAGKVLVRLQSGDNIHTVRNLSANSNYLLDLTKYSGTFYVAVGASSDNKVYIYKDPAKQLASGTLKAAVPTQVLHVNQPNFLSFSSNAQYILAENGTEFGVYDIENKHGYKYTATLPLDAAQAHAVWMDGNRLTYVSGGKQVVLEYDNNNQRSLAPALAAYDAVFAPDFKYSYNLAPGGSGTQVSLTQTALLIPSEL